MRRIDDYFRSSKRAREDSTTTAHRAAINNLRRAIAKKNPATSLSIALSLNDKNGKPSKKTSIISRQKPSKYASTEFAFKQAMQILCPTLKLVMHTPITSAMTVGSGVQAVIGDNTIAFTFPTKQQIIQAAYKMSIDMAFYNRGFTQKASTASATSSNQQLGQMDPNLLPGGSFETTAGNGNLPDPVAYRTLSDNSQFNNYPGIIMKYYKKIYTFFNVSTNSMTLQVYEFIKADSYNNTAPASFWSQGLQQTILHNNGWEIAPYGTSNPNIYSLGERPRKDNTELNRNWRTHKISSYTIQPGQSLIHTCYLPRIYYKMDEILDNDNDLFVKNKTMSVMFILNGELAYEGDAGTGSAAGTQNVAQGQTQAVIGTSTGTLNYRVNAEAMFQSIPQGQKYAEVHCREDLITPGQPNYGLARPMTLIATALQISKDVATSLDAGTTGEADNVIN